MHGGKVRASQDNQNALKHGRYAAQAIAERRALLKGLRATLDSF